MTRACTAIVSTPTNWRDTHSRGVPAVIWPPRWNACGNGPTRCPIPKSFDKKNMKTPSQLDNVSCFQAESLGHRSRGQHTRVRPRWACAQLYLPGKGNPKGESNYPGLPFQGAEILPR